MKFFNARLALVIGLLGFSFLPSARSEELLMGAGNIRACFVDLQEVLRSFPEYGKAKDSLEDWAKPKQKMISEKEKSVQMLDNNLKQNILLSEEAKKEKEGEFRKELENFQEMVKQLQEELSEKEAEFMAPVKDVLSKTIEEVAKAKGFNVVFDVTPAGRPILYVDDSLDITEEVVQKVKQASGSKDSAKPDKSDKSDKPEKK